MAAEPAHGHPVTNGVISDAVTQLGDGAGDLVAGRDRPRQAGERALDEGVVGAADTARGHVDTDVAACR